MSRSGTLILLGVLVAALPFAGIPFSILTWIYLVFGIMVVLTGVSLRLRRPKEPVSEEPIPSFDIHEPRPPFTQ